jgi:hypothetical protein
MGNIYHYANDARRRANRASASAQLHDSVARARNAGGSARVNVDRGAVNAQIAAQHSMLASLIVGGAA